MEDVDCNNAVFTRQQVYHHFRNSRAVGEIVKRPSAGCFGIPPDFRCAVETGRGKLNPVQVSLKHKFRKCHRTVSDADLPVLELDLIFCDVVMGSRKSSEPSTDCTRRILCSHTVEICPRRCGCGRGVGYFARVC